MEYYNAVNFCNREDEFAKLIRDVFGNENNIDYKMNSLILSSGGCHGSFITLDNIEKEANSKTPIKHTNEDGEEQESMIIGDSFIITASIYMPRKAAFAYGNARFKLNEIQWLRNVVTKSVCGLTESQNGNLLKREIDENNEKEIKKTKRERPFETIY